MCCTPCTLTLSSTSRDTPRRRELRYRGLAAGINYVRGLQVFFLEQHAVHVQWHGACLRVPSVFSLTLVGLLALPHFDLGYPGTMAADGIHYLAADRVSERTGRIWGELRGVIEDLWQIVTPVEHCHHFTERLLLLPQTYLANDHKQVQWDLPCFSPSSHCRSSPIQKCLPFRVPRRL